MQNGRALRDAPVVFLATLLIALVASYWLIGLRYEGVLDQKNGTIEALKTQVAGLQQQLGITPHAQSAPSVPVRNPDGIYQFDVQVGLVEAPDRDDGRGIVSFGAIVGAVKLNTDRDFEYRDLVLHIRNFATETRSVITGQQGRALNQVTCEIVGHVRQ
jgi:hypothetical protein